jgi:hypothetical protein
VWLSFPKPSDAERPVASAAERSAREWALRRAKVLFAPSTLGADSFDRDPNAGTIDPHLTTCTIVPGEATGTTPKFECRLQNGEKIKVKYGWTREIPAEIAATRLLQALGFPSDRMSRVARLRCYGCVVSPFHFRLAAGTFGLERTFERHLDYSRATEFSDVAVERKFPGDAVETSSDKGWGFHELSKIDAASGGATRAEIDALRLMAMFLAHWDNKAENQRLVCQGSAVPCDGTIAMLHDLGSDFGPYKVNAKGWKNTPIWADARACGLSMKGMPYDGATFEDVRISEAGRQLVADRLGALTTDQIFTLFRSAGFSDLDQWVSAFEDKVRQIANNRCPSLSGVSS